jgi:hypothetical protein
MPNKSDKQKRATVTDLRAVAITAIFLTSLALVWVSAIAWVIGLLGSDTAQQIASLTGPAALLSPVGFLVLLGLHYWAAVGEGAKA